MKTAAFFLFMAFSTFVHATGFESYFFSVEGNCKDPKQMTFHRTITGQTQKIGTTPEGHPIMIWFNLALFPNKTYYLEYIEYSSRQLENGKYEQRILFGKPYSGNWKEFGSGIQQLDFLGEEGQTIFAAVPSMFTINGKRALQFMIPPGFEREPARMKFALLYQSAEKTAAYGESSEVYCQNPY